MTRRVVISGAGIVCPLGSTVDEFWKNCLDGKTNISPIPEHWAEYSSYQSKYWSPLPPLAELIRDIPRSYVLKTDPVALLAICSARQALLNAGYKLSVKSKHGYTFEIDDVDNTRIGVYMGTGVGGANSFLENHTYPILSRSKDDLSGLVDALPQRQRDILETVLEKLVLPRRVNPFVVSMLMPNAVSAVLGLTFNITGPNTSYCVACASGSVAIGNAYRSIKSGLVDAALAGGAEFLDDRYGYIFKGFDVAGTLARGDQGDRINRPFDRDRTGFLFSQGASAVLVLENLDIALRRKTPILAEVVGFAESFDSYSIMNLNPDGKQINRMILDALGEANIPASGVDYVNAHGTGTLNNDQVESETLEKIFQKKVLVNTTKSLVGHTIGASGALEALVTALSLRNQTTHVCKNLEHPVRALNFVQEVKQYPMEVGLTHSFAFGGHNAGLVLKRFDA